MSAAMLCLPEMLFYQLWMTKIKIQLTIDVTIISKNKDGRLQYYCQCVRVLTLPFSSDVMVLTPCTNSLASSASWRAGSVSGEGGMGQSLAGDVSLLLDIQTHHTHWVGVAQLLQRWENSCERYCVLPAVSTQGGCRQHFVDILKTK